ncbi:MAG: M16 family metallopeptidase [Gammaproteobacteria bacterium]
MRFTLSTSFRRLCAPLLVAGLVASLSACTTTTSTTAVKSDGPSDIFTTPYTLETLDNGLTVMIVKTDYPDIVNLQMPVQTGSRNEIEPGKSGFAHFFEHMMFRGTDKYPAEEYLEILKNAGADQNAYTTDDFTNYHVTFTKDDLEKILEIEADRFQNLKYTEDQFRTEAQAVKGEYLKNSSNPVSKLFEVIRESSFKTHTYGHTTMGYLRDIEDMPNQMEYSKEFFDRWYRPEKSALILTGDVDPDNALKLIIKYFGSWERGTFESIIPEEAAPTGPVYEHIAWENPTQPWLIMAFRGPRFDPSRKEMPTMDIFSSVFLSQSSALYQKVVVEDRLVDQLFPYFPDRKDPNLLLVGARLTDVANANKVRDAISATLADARVTPIDTQKLEQAKSRLRYQFAGGLDNSAAIGDLLARYMQFDNDPEVINRVYRQYAAVTPQDVMKYANTYFVDSGMVVATLANGAEMEGFDPETSIDALVSETSPRMAETSSSSDDLAARIAAWTPDLPPTNAGGANFILQPSKSSPLIDVSFVFDAGAANDPVGKKGLALLTAAMLTDAGSKAFTYEEINKAMYPIAAGFGAQVDKEMTKLAGSVHRDNLDTWYTLVRSQLLTPAFAEEDFNRLKTRAINAVRTDLVGNNDEELGKEMLYQRIFGKSHAYGSYNGGHTDDLASITLDDVKAFYARHYSAKGLRVGMSGGYTKDFLNTVTQDVARLPKTTAVDTTYAKASLNGGRNAVIIEKDTQAVAVSFGFPIDLVRGDDDWVALWLARSWLGEHRSSNSHLFARIREQRGMNYGDYAYVEYFPGGMFQFHPDANLAREQQIFQVWVRPLRTNTDAHFATRTAMFELQKLIDNGLTEEQFQASRNFLQKFVSLLVKSQSRQLGYAIDSDYYDIDTFTKYVRAELAELTAADVNRAIRKHLQTDNMEFVFVAKDASSLREALMNDMESPIKYNSPKPELEAEDRVISVLPLRFRNVEIVPGEEVFK